jgi:hypothetical protein
MIPNNNLSVLPWYTSIEQQNARKWWVYNRIYPLFTPAGYLLPFQLMREHRVGFVHDDTPLSSESYFRDEALDLNGEPIEIEGGGVSVYDVQGCSAVYFENVPRTFDLCVTAVAKNEEGGNILGTFIAPFVDNFYTGGWVLPEGTNWIEVQTGHAGIGSISNIYKATINDAPILSFDIYAANGEHIGTWNPSEMGFTIVPFASQGYDILVFPGQQPVLGNFEDGQYYAVMSDGTEIWYSEIFTVVNNIKPYLKITWWDMENFVMDAGTIVYKNPAFKNVLYLQADIAKPEYPFEEEGETRDGYFFPIKQISEKHYRFSFLASEYLLDVMRFIRMADYARIEKNGQIYNLDTFLITPDWEDNGDVAAVEAEFDTATVAKKIGQGYIQPTGGDFNNDFNNDF